MQTFAHSQSIKDSIIIARFICHDHTASTVCYLRETSPAANGIKKSSKRWHWPSWTLKL